ncbi:MAG: DNA polymerase III subunit delta [candidate division WS2 bacterium ADurb.Bin280]|uniref:DNA polymerase III subunit delta n=1 Tax=candidate division WS2 bacterium ADurb.Bin280 TaxID=1852829 RepID=A0A1V5SEI6_9BACT|nr:MAG: DNA polymerase III subunit delta [candidate division WS2 bacterium ADurb.Bin280]
MYLFFFGENDYLIREKISELEQRYKKSSASDFDLTKIDGEQAELSELSANIQAVPLLATTRLILVRNIVSNKNKQTTEGVASLLGRIPPSTVVVFYQVGPIDRRTAIFKALTKDKKRFQEFKNLEGRALESFIDLRCRENGVAISAAARSKMIEIAGRDLWRLVNEIDKLSLYVKEKIELDDVMQMVSSEISANVFALTDSLLKRNKKSSAKLVKDIIESGEVPLKVLGAIIFSFRAIAQIKDAIEQDQKMDNYKIAKICNLKPFVVSKNRNFAQAFSWENLSHIYNKIILVDERIKSGKIEDAEGLKELVLAI